MSLKYPTTSKTLLDKIASGDEISWDEFYPEAFWKLSGISVTFWRISLITFIKYTIIV